MVVKLVEPQLRTQIKDTSRHFFLEFFFCFDLLWFYSFNFTGLFQEETKTNLSKSLLIYGYIYETYLKASGELIILLLCKGGSLKGFVGVFSPEEKQRPIVPLSQFLESN